MRADAGPSKALLLLAACHGCFPLRADERSAPRFEASAPTASRQTPRCWQRRPEELTELRSFLRSALVRCGTEAPCHCYRGYAMPDMTLRRLPLRTGALQFRPCVPDRRSLSGSLPRAGCSRLCRVVAVQLTLKALTLLVHCTASFVLPNVRAKGATTAGRQARAGENVPRTA